MHAHDCVAAVHDLRQLIKQVTADKMGISEVDSVPLVLVGNSVGCALARLYAQEYKGAVAGLVLLDSVLANSDFVSIIPDPDSPDFDQSQPLPDGVTADILRAARAVLRKTFHPSNGSKASAAGTSAGYCHTLTGPSCWRACRAKVPSSPW